MKMNRESIIVRDSKPYMVRETDEVKACISEDYNFIFDKTNGQFFRWGRTKDDDPNFSPVGPEILDLEISVNGCPNACKFCYKANTNDEAINMTFEQFKNIIDKMPPVLTQIAFGITGVQTNPDFIPMLKYCREKGIIPNFTLSGIDITDDLADEIVKHVGAVAVSAYETDKNVCYDTVKMFTDRGIKQVNIHLMVSQETLLFVYNVLEDSKTDHRLDKLNAIVFLGVKPKGRAEGAFKSLSMASFTKLLNHAFDNKMPIGFDSCSAPKFEKAIRESDKPDDWKQRMIQLSESCESSIFSAYINVYGEMWYCSFSENEKGVKAVNVLEAESFLRDVWYAPETIEFRNRVLAMVDDNGCRRCVTFPVINI